MKKMFLLSLVGLVLLAGCKGTSLEQAAEIALQSLGTGGMIIFSEHIPIDPPWFVPEAGPFLSDEFIFLGVNAKKDLLYIRVSDGKVAKVESIRND